MNIQHDDPRWTAYVLGELSDADRAEVERELESSAEAREIVDEIRMMTMLLKDELAKESPAAMDPNQKRTVRAAAAVSPAPAKRPWVIGGFAAAAIAALLVFAVALPSLLRTPGQELKQAVSVPPPAAAPADAPAAAEPAAAPASPSQVAADLKDQEKAADEDKAQAPKVQATDGEGLNLNAKMEVANVAEEVAKFAETVPVTNSLLEKNKKDAGKEAQVAQRQSAARNEAPKATDAIIPVADERKQLGEAKGGFRAPGVMGGVLIEPSAPAAAPPSPPPAPRSRLDRPANNFNTESYDRIEDNSFRSAAENPLATFSIDVDTASYANVRRFLNQNQTPPKDAVRIEELINYFNYDYAQPSGPHPIAVHSEAASAPWSPTHRLVRIGVKAKDVDMSRRPASNLVFLIDVSGSMMTPDKLPLLKSGLKLLIDRLSENDRVSMVVYAGNSGLVLPPTMGYRKEIILQALDRLEAGGSTNGAAGIQLAYNTAVSNFIRGGINRVILCTDGDFNVGVTNEGDLTRLIEDKAKSGVFLSVLGFGTGNLKDSTMEKLADKGNGNYAYIDSINEARKVLVEQMSGTLMTVAKDVKIQVDFNPEQVSAYRLIGYENRVLANQDFNDDTRDAGDMGAGHTVTALFEVVPRGVDVAIPGVEPSKYQQPAAAAAGSVAKRDSRSNELLTVRVRYKKSDAADSTRFDIPLVDRRGSFNNASSDFQFAAAVAEFGMVLRDSPYKGSASMDQVIDLAQRNRGSDRNGYRDEFVSLVRKARSLNRW